MANGIGEQLRLPLDAGHIPRDDKHQPQHTHDSVQSFQVDDVVFTGDNLRLERRFA